MLKIDAHLHLTADHPEGLSLLNDLDLKLLNICVAQDSAGQWRDQAETYQQLMVETPTRFGWCTSFDLPRFDDPDYIDRVIAGLEADFAAGAVACKIWKNIGMEVRKPDGNFLMIDDPLFDPIFDYLTRIDTTLLLHIGEPLACWQPLTEDNPHVGYYRNNPQWHMYQRPEFPHHSEIIAARDHMVAKHPKLRVVGAHFASLEYDVAEVAKRFDRYPNFAVDTSARLLDLTYQPVDKVRQFFLDYQDRILWGTDIVQRRPLSAMDTSEQEQVIAGLRTRFQAELDYYALDQRVIVRNREVEGLGLPEPVLEKILRINAERWYPGLV